MKRIIINISKGIILLFFLSVLTLLVVLDANAQGPVLNRAEVVKDRIYDYGPVGVDGSVMVTGLELEQNGNSLLLAFNVEVNRRAINNRQSWRIVPEVTLPETGEYVEFPTLLITGRQKERHFKRKDRFGNRWLGENYPDFKTSVPKGGDTVITYRATVPYELWMDNAHLNLHQYLASPKEKRQLFSSHGYAAVKHEVREPYTVQPLVSYIEPGKEEKHRSAGFRSMVDFPVNVYRIMPDYRRNPDELASIDRQLGLFRENPYIEIEAIFMEGYASPEGSRAVNERLALRRVEALKDYFVTNHGINAHIISTRSVTEDWDGLRGIVDTWPQSAPKERVMAVIDSPADPDVKETRLRALPEWVRLVKEVFPHLRRTEYRIDYKVRDFTVGQSRSLIKIHPELFSHYELYVLAMSVADDPEKRLEILETILRYYPDDDTALNNYGAALLDAGEHSSARRYLDRMSDKSVAANNFGVLYLLDGDYEKAERCFESSGREESIHNLQELRLKSENDKRLSLR